jgi:trehalose/maltose transport system substrate-binding protein
VALKHCPTATIVRVLIVLLIASTLVSCHQAAPAPITLNYLRTGWIRPSELPATEALSRKFLRETGFGFRYLHGVQEDTLDQLTLTRKLLQEGSSGPDVLEIDVTWLGVLRDDLIDLKPYLGAETSAIGPGISSSYVVDGKVVAIPLNINGGILAYRSDLLREYGYAHPPRTWPELEKIAARIQQGERAKGRRNFWGYVWPGAAAESLTCNALEWQMSEGGGAIIESDRTISVNNRAAIEAWQRAKHWIGWISPPSTTDYKESDVHSAFDLGRAAFARVWGGEAGGLPRNGGPSRLYYAGDHFTISEVGYTAVPAGSFASVGALGGSGLGISRYSLHPEEDADLIRFLLREQPGSIEEGVTPDLSTKAVAYDFTAPLGSHDNSSGVVKAVVVSRPSSVAARSYEQVTNAYFRTVHSVLTGEKPASEAAAELETNLIQITGFNPGPVRKN